MRRFEDTARDVADALDGGPVSDAVSINDLTVVPQGEIDFDKLGLPWGFNTFTLVDYVRKQEKCQFRRMVVEVLQGMSCAEDYRGFCRTAHTHLRRSGVVDFSAMEESDAAKAHDVMKTLRELPDPGEISARYTVPMPSTLEKACGYMVMPFIIGGFAAGAIIGGEAAEHLLESHPYIAHIATAVSGAVGAGIGLLAELGIIAPVSYHMDRVRERTKIAEDSVLAEKVDEYITAHLK